MGYLSPDTPTPSYPLLYIEGVEVMTERDDGQGGRDGDAVTSWGLL